MALRGRGLLKLECWQPTGSFKVRGALHNLLTLSPETLRHGVVTASAGNHALGLAWAVATLGGIAARVHVPESAPRAKLDKLRAFPVEVVVAGRDYDAAHAAALEHERQSGSFYVHAYDDERTAAGQGSVALELLEQRPELATVLVPVGGGGLISGMACALKALRPAVRVIAVQPSASPALTASFRAGRALHEYPAGPTLADGVSGGIGDIVFEHRALIDDVIEVPEPALEDAIAALLCEDQVVAEGSGALPVAALRAGLVNEPGPVVAVITGGNVDGSVLARLLRERA
jgi:threonine dehydratase